MIDFDGINGSPSTSTTNKAKIYFDVASGKLKCSENGGAYADCVGGGSGTGTVNTGTINFHAKYPATGTTVDDSAVLMDDGTNVGVGTITPSTKLDVSGTVEATLFRVDGFGTAPQITNVADTNTGLFFSGPDIAEFHTGGANALIMTATQNVGIDTHSPSAKLYIYNEDAGDSFRVDDVASDTSPFIINSVGNVGIGTLTPGMNGGLDILSGTIRLTQGNIQLGVSPGSGDIGLSRSVTNAFFSGPPGMTLKNSSTATRSNTVIQLEGNNGSTKSLYVVNGLGDSVGMFPSAGAAIGTNTNHPFGFFTNNTERARFDSSGNLGIGSISPGTALDVQGSIRASSGTAGQAACWKADKTLGQCTSVVGVSGGCTCS